MELDAHQVRLIVTAALNEDLGSGGDVTTAAVVEPTQRGKATLVSRCRGVVAGVGVALQVFRHLDPDLEVVSTMADGDRLVAGSAILGLAGRAAALLTAERVALNFLQRLSGIATLTAAFVERLAGTGCVVLDTRKTTPLLRPLERHAVRVAGGQNHRFGLFDAMMLKDNHFDLAARAGSEAADYRQVVETALRRRPAGMLLHVEARNPEEARAATAAGADIVLLDNMTLKQLSQAVSEARHAAGRAGRRVLLEASGGITLENVAAVAATGVDRVSVGALTHSAPALDIAMDLEPLP